MMGVNQEFWLLLWRVEVSLYNLKMIIKFVVSFNNYIFSIQISKYKGCCYGVHLKLQLNMVANMADNDPFGLW